MKLGSVAGWAVVGMFLSSAAAFAVPTSHGAAPPLPPPLPPIVQDPASEVSSHFVAGQTLTVDGRLGHGSIAKGANGETFLFASVNGANGAAGAGSPGAVALNLAIVVDRSGSMKGARIANAIQGAVGTVDHMRDGDTVTVVAFDNVAEVIVPPTEVSLSSRGSIDASIRGIRLRGDTCMSCGLEEAMVQLQRAPAGTDRVSRILLLSDGAANHGIKDVPGLRAMAQRIRDRGVTVSTVGVDVEFDERVMAAIAQEANGRHYFAATPEALANVFAQELDSLVATIARDAEMSIDLAPGIEVDEVFDRSFRREGTRIIVPFGTFSSRQEKTVLMKLRVPVDREGAKDVASVKLTYRDLVQRTDGTCQGKLGVRVMGDGTAQRDLDPFVAARLARSVTSKALTTANSLFEQGRVNEAQTLLRDRVTSLKKDEDTAHAAAKAMPAPALRRAASLDDDFKSQMAAVESANAGFAAPPPSMNAGPGSAGGGAVGSVAQAAAPAEPAAAPAPESREGKAARKTNQANANDLGF